MLNSRNLEDLREDVRANVEALLCACRAQEMKILITQTKRDNEYQAYLYEQGRTRPGSIITNSKTTTFHGAGLAVDFCQNIKGHEYDDPSFFLNVSVIAKAIGFSWGGDWKSFVDKPHLQWDNHGRYTAAMLRAGKLCPIMPKYQEVKAMKPYQTIDEIRREAPCAVATIEKLVERGALRGGGGGLQLSEDMLRILVILDRMDLYR